MAYRALRRGLLNFEQRQFYRGPEAYVDLPSAAEQVDTRIAEALAEHPDNDELRAAVVLEASPRKVVAVLQNGETITVTGDGLKPVTSGLADKAEPKMQIRRGAVVRALRNAKGDWSLTQVPEVEGAFVAIDPASGAIRALVGGFDYGKSQVQPCHAGLAPARLELQALHLLGGAGKGLHAGDRGQRRAAVLRCRRHRQPALGAEELRRQVRRADAAAHARWRSRRTWCRSACCSRSARASRRNGSRASASRPTSTRPT